MPYLRGRRRETHFIRCQHLLNCDERIQCLGSKTARKKPIVAVFWSLGDPEPYPLLRPRCFGTGVFVGAKGATRDGGDWRDGVRTAKAALPVLSMPEA